MKLKNLLVFAFLMLTLIPIIVISLLLYQSGFNLSKEAYTRNLLESLTVQADYVSQSIENDMLSDLRFAKRIYALTSDPESTPETTREAFLDAFQSYLETAEDRVAACILLNKDDVPVYTIGEQSVLDAILKQLPDLKLLQKPVTQEFTLPQGTYSFGIITPIQDRNKTYAGTFISVYSKYHVFKKISSYYKIVDTSTYLCRENGTIINSRMLQNKQHNEAIEKALDILTLSGESRIDMRIESIPVFGYYKHIQNTPWFLVGFIDEAQIYTFTNHFVWMYFFIILGVCIADLILAFYFSRKVVAPINSLIQVMDGYKNRMTENVPQYREKLCYFEIRYLWEKFSELMKKIMLAQHNFEAVYQLYQSNAMGDINIDIDVVNQTAECNKDVFRTLMSELKINHQACIVERFVNCFCEKDQKLVMNMLEEMRDQHLSVAKEVEIYTPHLGEKWFHTLIVPLYRDDRLARLFIQLRDISNFKKQEHESIEQAMRDPLTGLYNRSGFTKHVTEILKVHGDEELHGLFFIDMNFFKLVNDTLGHSAGDTVLCSVGSVLRDTLCEGGIASRFGGDEFAVFLPNVTLEAVENLREELNRQLVYPFHSATYSFVVSASIGVTTWTATSKLTLEDLMHRADEDMYATKRHLKQNLER